MITRYEHNGVQWIDVERPTQEEVDVLADEFTLGPAVAQEMCAPTQRPRVNAYPTFVYVILHFPATRVTRGQMIEHEIDIVVGKDFVITIHYETIPAIQDFARSFETVMLLNRSRGTFHSGHVIFELASRLYQSVENELQSIEDSVTGIENAIFDGRERVMVQPISVTTRELLNHKRILGGQEEILELFESAGVAIFPDSFKAYMSSMSTLHYRAYNHAQMLMDTLSELRDTNDSLLSTRQNEIMKNLTIMASIILPLSLVASIFGMNTVNNPIIGSPNDFWVIVSMMSIVGVLATAYFLVKRWY